RSAAEADSSAVLRARRQVLTGQLADEAGGPVENDIKLAVGRHAARDGIRDRRAMATAERPTGQAITHEVTNQPPPLLGHNAFDADPALQEALTREGGEWGIDRARELGALVASEEADEHR